MKTNITRRHVLGTLAAVAFTPPDSLLPIAQQAHRPPAELTLAEWLEREAPDLPAMAELMADCERDGVEAECADWQRLDYTDAIKWRAGVTLLLGFGSPAKAIVSHDAARKSIDAAGIKSLAAAWSYDNRAWTRFLLADQNHVAEVLGIDGDKSR